MPVAMRAAIPIKIHVSNEISMLDEIKEQNHVLGPILLKKEYDTCSINTSRAAYTEVSLQQKQYYKGDDDAYQISTSHSTLKMNHGLVKQLDGFRLIQQRYRRICRRSDS